MVPNPTTDVADYNSLVSHSLCCIDNPMSYPMKILYLYMDCLYAYMDVCLYGLVIIMTSFCKEVS